MDYNSLPSNCFDAHIFPDTSSGNSLTLASVSFVMFPSFFEYFFALWHKIFQTHVLSLFQP